MSRYLGALLLMFGLTSHPAQAMSCQELSEFLINIALARTMKPELTPTRMTHILLEDENFTSSEKIILGKYIKKSFTKADPAKGAFVSIDRRDCSK
jgi:hypothetical protein